MRPCVHAPTSRRQGSCTGRGSRGRGMEEFNTEARRTRRHTEEGFVALRLGSLPRTPIKFSPCFLRALRGGAGPGRRGGWCAVGAGGGRGAFACEKFHKRLDSAPD